MFVVGFENGGQNGKDACGDEDHSSWQGIGDLSLITVGNRILPTVLYELEGEAHLKMRTQLCEILNKDPSTSCLIFFSFSFIFK